MLSVVDSKMRWLRSSAIRVNPMPADVYPRGMHPEVGVERMAHHAVRLTVHRRRHGRGRVVVRHPFRQRELGCSVVVLVRSVADVDVHVRTGRETKLSITADVRASPSTVDRFERQGRGELIVCGTSGSPASLSVPTDTYAVARDRYGSFTDAEPVHRDERIARRQCQPAARRCRGDVGDAERIVEDDRGDVVVEP